MITLTANRQGPRRALVTLTAQAANVDLRYYSADDIWAMASQLKAAYDVVNADSATAGNTAWQIFYNEFNTWYDSEIPSSWAGRAIWFPGDATIAEIDQRRKNLEDWKAKLSIRSDPTGPRKPSEDNLDLGGLFSALKYGVIAIAVTVGAKTVYDAYKGK